MTDIIDYLEADLDARRDLIYELQIAEENSPQEADAYSALIALVKTQDEACEPVLQSLVSTSGARSSRLRSAIQDVIERMRGARDVEAMIECCSNRATWRASNNVYCEMLDSRIAKERKELFPVLHDELSSRERIKLGLLYRKFRGFGQPSAHQKNWQKIWASIFNQAG